MSPVDDNESLLLACQNCGFEEAEYSYNKLLMCFDCYEEAKEIDESMSVDLTDSNN